MKALNVICVRFRYFFLRVFFSLGPQRGQLSRPHQTTVLFLNRKEGPLKPTLARDLYFFFQFVFFFFCFLVVSKR